MEILLLFLSGWLAVANAGLDCPGIHDPVCGSDSQTYQSDCHLRSAACDRRTRLFTDYKGECIKHCNFPCSLITQKVCGSDGKTHRNHCFMRRKSCRDQKAIMAIRWGKCLTGDSKCSLHCGGKLDPVCASDGNKYNNECDMRTEACKKGEAIIMISKADNDLKCPGCKKCTEEINEVCGSDGETYSNECILNYEVCKEKVAVITVHSGPCKTIEKR